MSSQYFYIHTISYYLGNERDINIEIAAQKLLTYKLSMDQTDSDNNLFIIYVLYDILNDDIISRFDKFKSKNDNLDIVVLYRYNTGGTVQTMFYTYNYLIQNNITSKFIGVWEDDAIFKNPLFLDTVKSYLLDDYILTGPLFTKSNRYGIKQFDYPYSIRKSVVPWCKHMNVYNDSTSTELIDDKLYKWCDGCGYITTIENLTKIKDKMGKFTLAPENERYTHCEHGINYGEVGFCTRLSLNGFKFIGLPANIYYQQLEQKTIGNKNI